MKVRAGLAALAIAACASCGSREPLAPTNASSAPTARSAPATGSDATTSADGFYILVVQCEPKAKGDKRAHFEVAPASGSAPPLQLRCKGQGDLHGPGPWLVRPMADTDQAYHCSPNPITLKERKQKNRVVCSKG